MYKVYLARNDYNVIVPCSFDAAAQLWGEDLSSAALFKFSKKRNTWIHIPIPPHVHNARTIDQLLNDSEVEV